MVDSPYLWTIIFGLVIIGILVYRANRKYKLGEVFEIKFDDGEKSIITKSVNLLNNKTRTKKIPYDRLIFTFREQENSLFGHQRIIEIFDQMDKVHLINVDLTGWVRHGDIELLIDKIKNWAQQKTELE
jgi:hypothetical protein